MLYTYIYLHYIHGILRKFILYIFKGMYTTYVFNTCFSFHLHFCLGQTVSPEISQASFRESNRRLKLRVNLPVPESVKMLT